MAAMLLIVFRSRLRLLPLAIALAAAGITFGATSLPGATLTMASIAVLPILIGLAVDYAIQFQSRVQEFRHEGSATRDSVVDAVARAAGEGAPTIATAALATATGFLVLLLSPVPMVRGFGLLLVVGIAIALVVALTAGSAALVARRPETVARGRVDARRGGDPARAPARSWHLCGRAAGHQRGDAATRCATRRPGLGGSSRAWSAGPSACLAADWCSPPLGWVADTQTSVQTDVTKLVPSNMPALRDLHTLENVTGVSGEIDVTVHAPNVATPTVIGWMIRYERRAAEPLRLPGDQGLRAGDAVPGAVAARPVLDGQPGDDQGAAERRRHKHAARGSPQLLLAGGASRPIIARRRSPSESG